MPGERFHRFVRTLTRVYPYRVLAYEFNRALSPFLDSDTPLWLRTDPYRDCPIMDLNVAEHFQRKIFYFPRAYTRHWWGAPLGAYLRTMLRAGDIFLDIGANIGFYSLLAARLVGPTGAVLAFEPEPMVFESLSRSARVNGAAHLRCVNLALSNREGDAVLFRTRDTAHSLVDATRFDREFSGQVAVRVTTLDRYWQEINLAPVRIRVIKIDVEGVEASTVAGMVETLQRAGYPSLWVEVRGPKGSQRAPDTFKTTYAVLRPLGYRAFRWRVRGETEVSEADVRGQEDILFIRPAGA